MLEDLNKNIVESNSNPQKNSNLNSTYNIDIRNKLNKTVLDQPKK